MRTDNIKVVLLAGSRDFGRCPLKSQLPLCLWQVVDRPALQVLLDHLADQKISKVTICSNGEAKLITKSLKNLDRFEIDFFDETLPVGTAGCIREAAKGDEDNLFIIFPAAVIQPPGIESLIEAHNASNSDMTIMLENGIAEDMNGQKASGIYVCEPSVLNYIPSRGYCDIKETLIANMIGQGASVKAVKLTKPILSFTDKNGYIDAISEYISSDGFSSDAYPVMQGSSRVMLAKSADVSSSARIFGPAVIMDGAKVQDGSVIFGPAVIGRNASIGNNTLIDNSILWDGFKAGDNCEIRDSVAGYGRSVPSNIIVEHEVIACSKNCRQLSTRKNQHKAIEDNNTHSFGFIENTEVYFKSILAKIQSKQILSILFFAALSIVLLWSYWPGIVDIWRIWIGSDEYSSGLLVPLIAFYILWSRRDELASLQIRPSLLGVIMLIAAQGIRFIGLIYWYSSLERISLVLTIISLALIVFGQRIIGKTWGLMLFLFLMLPLPQSVHSSITLPLQDWATKSAVFALEMIGYVVRREGNIIHLNDTSVAIAEACNGLRMITAFLVIASLVVFLAKRSLLEKIILLISCIPIAIFCNTVRLAGTAIAFTRLDAQKWETIFHDFGGYAMMPLALCLIVVELWLMRNIITIREN